MQDTTPATKADIQELREELKAASHLMRSDLKEFQKHTVHLFQQVDRRFDQVDQRFDEMNRRLAQEANTLDIVIECLENTTQDHKAKVAWCDIRLDRLEQTAGLTAV